MEQNKKVLLVSFSSLERGGFQAFLKNLICCTREEPISYIWYLPKPQIIDNEYAKEFVDLNVELQVRSDISKQSRIVQIFKTAKGLFNILKCDIDIVYINTGSILYAALASVISKIRNVPVIIVHSHSAVELTKAGIEKRIKSLLRSIINNCAGKRAACSVLAAEALFGKKHAKDAVIIPNCIDTRRFSFLEENRKKVRMQYGLEKCFVIGQIARLSPEKNQKFILDILKELQKKDNTVRALLVGDGSIKTELMEYAAQIGIDKYVKFAGGSQTPEKFYSAMDVFLLPSLYEGFPITGLEAQASGLPCFFADTITREAKLSEKCIYLSLQNSPREWAEKILLAREMKTSDRVNAWQEVANQGYDISCMREMICKLYGD